MPAAPPSDLSVAQSAIWFDQTLFADKPIYNTGQALTITGSLRLDLFERALRATIAESPALQLPPRSAALHFEVPVLDLREQPDPRAAAQHWMLSQMRTPIAMDDPLLFRFALIRVADERTIWFQKYHHIIIDATGRRLLSERTAVHYRALRSGTTAPVLQCAAPEDLLSAERRYAASSDYEADRAYWVAQLAQRPGPLLETHRRHSERGRSGCHARTGFTLRRADFERLERAARAVGSSPFRAVIALTYAAFAALYDRAGFVMGLELANRSTPSEKRMVGLLARPLPQLLRFDPDTPVREVLRELDQARVRDYPHRRFPLQELISALGITRAGGYGLFDVIVNFIPASYEFAFEKEPVELANLSYGFPAPWMVTIADTGLGRDLDVAIDTDPGLISAESAARLAACLENLLTHGLDEMDRPVAQLPLLATRERERLLRLVQGPAVPLPATQTLTTLCASQAQRTPDAIAIRCGTRVMSFRELHERAERLAHRLAGLGVRPGVIVGVALPRTPSLIVAVLAVHKAGGAYLALDPAYPAERLQFMIADSAVPIILTDAALSGLFAASGARLVFCDESQAPAAAAPLAAPARAEDIAYVLYTSGSTGRPKAVGVEHRNLVNLIRWGRSVVSDEELGGLLFATSLNFDLSAFEMFLPLAFGGCIILVENLLALHTTPQRDRVRLVNTGPSLIEALMRTGGLPPGVSTVILAGERLSRRLADALFGDRRDIRLLNCYGPTETTVYSSCARVDPASRLEPTIGRPIANTTFYVLNSRRTLLPAGAEGELFIGGAGVARGYLERPALTTERFVDNPFGDGRLYRTGDRVRWGADGELEFLGRIDEQVKINGLRVEPGEIEAALLAVPGIAAAAVILAEDPDGARRLAAYLVPAGGKPLDAGSVRAALERTLPPYMLPACFIWLASMPLTPGGKLDRRALPAAPREQEPRKALTVADSDLEREVARVWEAVLQRPAPRLDADFFELGGDSLALLNLFAAIETRFGRRLTIDALSGGLSIAGIVRELGRDDSVQASKSPIVTLQPHGTRPALFLVPGMADVLHLHRLGMHMPADRPVYAFHWTSADAALESVQELAAYFVAAMLQKQSEGPFYLGGYCIGAQIAYEMAQQLEAAGRHVALIAIIDQRMRGWRLTRRNLLPAVGHLLANVVNLWRDQLTPFDTIRRIPAAIGRLLFSGARAAQRRAGHRPHGAAPRRATPVAHWQTGETHLEVLRAYRPAPTRIPLSLFRATVTPVRGLPLDPTLGWRDVALGGVQVHRIPGDHTTMISEPLVRHLARALSEALGAAESRARDPGIVGNYPTVPSTNQALRSAHVAIAPLRSLGRLRRTGHGHGARRRVASGTDRESSADAD